MTETCVYKLLQLRDSSNQKRIECYSCDGHREDFCSTYQGCREVINVDVLERQETLNKYASMMGEGRR